MLTPLKKGDPVRVRLSDGRVVDAEYAYPCIEIQKCHRVNVFGVGYIALGAHHYKLRKEYGLLDHECVFVGPPAVCAPMGVSND